MLRGPYRDYIDLEGGDVSKIGDGIYTLMVPPRFSFEIPRDCFIHPGIIFQDSVDPNGLGGEMKIRDYYGNSLSCNWVALDEIGVLSKEVDEVEELKKEAHRILTILNQQDQSIQHYEVFDIKKLTKKHLLPFDIFNNEMTASTTTVPSEKKPIFPDFVFIATKSFEAPIKYDKLNIEGTNHSWTGYILFFYKEYLFVIGTKYPANMINHSIAREELKKRGYSPDQIQEMICMKEPDINEDDKMKIENWRIYKRMSENSTHDPMEIMSHLKKVLFKHYKSFHYLNQEEQSKS